MTCDFGQKGFLTKTKRNGNTEARSVTPRSCVDGALVPVGTGGRVGRSAAFKGGLAVVQKSIEIPDLKKRAKRRVGKEKIVSLTVEEEKDSEGGRTG